MSVCEGCPKNFGYIFNSCFNNNENSLKFLTEHNILPKSVKCPNCNSDCIYEKSRNSWKCNSFSYINKTKKKKHCGYSVSHYKGTILEKTKLQPWQVVVFAYQWVQKNFSHKTTARLCEISEKTSIDWRSFFCEVTNFWCQNQEPIGGPDSIVEIDETLISKAKYNRGRRPKQVWLFGGIDRESKRRFIVPLIDEEAVDSKPQPRNKTVLLPIIKKFILPGSTIISDCWGAYNSLKNNSDFKHYRINHSKNFVSPQDQDVHTQTIERLWRDVKEWIKKPGIRPIYLPQYIGRYLFLKAAGDQEIHKLFLEAAKLYPHSKEKQSVAFNPQEEFSDEDLSDS